MNTTIALSRRRLLGAGLAAGAAGVAHLGAPLTRALAAEAAAGDAWSADFAARLAADPMLLGWKGVTGDELDGTARIEGRLPPDLRGTFYRNGPAVHERFDLRYRHWFDGDGMVQAIRFDGAAVTHRGRVLHTPKLSHEDAAGRRVYPGFGTAVDHGERVRGPDDLNPANTSILDHHGELLALWEGGSASVLDRETLAWRGFKSWAEGFEGVPFTAHPKVEPDGTLWGFGSSYIPAPRLVLYHVAPDGGLVKAEVLDVGPLGMVHDFVVTERHLVIVVPPLVFEPEPEAARDGAFLDAFVWRPELGSRALVVARDDFGERRWHQLPAGIGFHHGNGWEESGGTIRFDHCVAPDPTLVTERFRYIMRGELRPAAPERYSRFTLHPDGRSEVEATPGWAEFPRVAPAVVGRRNRYVYTLGADEDATGPALQRLEKRDLESGSIDTFDFGPAVIPEEHVFVPRRGGRSEDDGWLVGTFLAFERGVSGVAVFDARRVGDGPVARAWLDYPLPLGFHGSFSPA